MAHEGDNPPLAARQTVAGWLASLGPAFESFVESNLLHDVLRIAADYGFREIGTIQSLRAMWKRAWEHWLGYRQTGRAGCQGAPAPL